MTRHHRIHEVPLHDGHDETFRARLAAGIEKGDELYRRKREQGDRDRTAVRFRVIKGMAMDTIGLGDARMTVAARRRELREHHVYAALPPSAQRAWEALADDVTELYREGERGPAWQLIEDLAMGQAHELATWEPPVAPPSESPQVLAAMVPRL